MASHLSRQLQDRVALVTGGGRGIGRGIALVLAERGAAVCVTDLDSEAADAVAAEIASAGGNAVPAVVDVTQPATLATAVNLATERFGHIDICVANAGVIASGGFEERDSYVEADWEVTSDVNVKGLANTADAVVPHMIERGFGRIINISSQGGRPPRGATLPLGAAIVPYLVSKAASIQLTHLQAMQLGRHNITVNAVCPGTVWTPMWERIAANRLTAMTREPAHPSRTSGWRAHGEDLLPSPSMGALRRSSGQAGQGEGGLKVPAARELFEAALETRHPITREQTPADVGYAVAFLASDDAAQITGQALNVNGGAVLS